MALKRRNGQIVMALKPPINPQVLGFSYCFISSWQHQTRRGCSAGQQFERRSQWVIMGSASQVSQSPVTRSSSRIDWVDYAKGFCIILVVMMHSTLRMGETMDGTGWLHYVVAFAKPFRMPDFFLISGLFLATVIDRDWRLYLDRKVVHFFYFYILWVLIQFAFKAPFSYADGHSIGHIFGSYLLTFVQPFGTLWFIYMLPVFFVVTKLLRHMPWYLLLASAAILQILPIHTGSVIIDEFASRYVYFIVGYLFATHIFRFAAWAMENPLASIAGLVVWGLTNGYMVNAGYSELPIVSLALGAMGAVAVVLASCLLSRIDAMAFLRYLGKNSIVVFLAFFFPMGVSRLLLAKFAPEMDIGLMSLIVTTVSVVGPVIMFKVVQFIGFGRFLFYRPAWAFIADKPKKRSTDDAKAALHPAE